MYGILISALWSVLSWIFKSVILKFVAFFILFFITTEFCSYLISAGILPNISDVKNYTNMIPSSVSYIFDVFNVYAGLSLVLSAYATRFMIRRIPVVG